MVRLSDGGVFSWRESIDLHTSARLAGEGTLAFTTATAGPVLTDPDSDLNEEAPAVNYIRACASGPAPDVFRTLILSNERYGKNEGGLIDVLVAAGHGAFNPSMEKTIRSI